MTREIDEPAALERLQQEQAPWVQHNFPGRPAHQPLLGICEELGELIDAAGLHGGGSNVYNDALADCMIFVADYCSAMGWSLAELWPNREAPPRYVMEERRSSRRELTRGLLWSVGKIQHHHLKTEQGIRGSAEDHADEAKGALCHLLALLDILAAPGNLVFLTLQTWERVKLRDFRKDSVHGGES